MQKQWLAFKSGFVILKSFSETIDIILYYKQNICIKQHLQTERKLTTAMDHTKRLLGLEKTLERIDGELVVVVMAGTRENFYDELKRYMKRT